MEEAVPTVEPSNYDEHVGQLDLLLTYLWQVRLFEDVRTVWGNCRAVTVLEKCVGQPDLLLTYLWQVRLSGTSLHGRRAQTGEFMRCVTWYHAALARGARACVLSPGRKALSKQGQRG